MNREELRASGIPDSQASKRTKLRAVAIQFVHPIVQCGYLELAHHLPIHAGGLLLKALDWLYS